MNAHTNAVSDSRFESQAIADAPTRPTRPFFWSVRRELWENRSIYIAPLAAAALVILAAILGSIHNTGVSISSGSMQGHNQPPAVTQQLNIIGLLIMGVTFVVAIFYSLDALYGERRDRSILFWKSLPISDTTATLAKASIPMVVIPMLTFVITAVTQWIVLAIEAASAAAHGGTLGHVPVLQIQAALLYHLIAVHSLWYAPIFAWLLLVSAWAPRAPILWAFLPPLAIGLVEKIAFNTAHFGHFIGYRISHGPTGSMLGSTEMLAHPLSGITPDSFLISPGLWGGLFVAALFLAAAVQLRRYRSPN
jgi:ABC-2 type transport system permease protein